MAKKKKKMKNPLAEQKLRQARSEKEFFLKLRYICDIIGGKDCYFKIPPIQLLCIYKMRGVFKIIAGKNSRVRKEDIDILQKGIDKMLKTKQMQLKPDDERKISYADYFTFFTPLGTIVKDEETTFEGIENFRAFFVNEEKFDNLYFFAIEDYLSMSCYYLSDIRNKWVYTFKSHIFIENADYINHYNGLSKKSFISRAWDVVDLRMHYEMTIDVRELESRTFFEGENKRKGIELYFWSYDKKEGKNIPRKMELCWIDFEPNSPFGKLKIPVYIQTHAIDRIMERMGYDSSAHGVILSLFALWRNEKIRLSEKQYLFAFYHFDLKCGYLLTELIDGCLLIRTFLFLTNNSTPEGKLLEEQTKLQKEDKKYFQIDNLKGLLYSDILENEMVCSIFKAAGCNSLLKLCKKIKDNEKKMEKQPYMEQELEKEQSKLSEELLKYLNKGQEEEKNLSEYE